jgi:deoxyadenosine/deoxycytidine kinase
MQPDKALIAILIKREHSRLASQVKSLEKLLEKPYSEANSKRLHDMYDKWQNNLCDEKGLPLVSGSMSELIDAYEIRSDSTQGRSLPVQGTQGPGPGG